MNSRGLWGEDAASRAIRPLRRSYTCIPKGKFCTYACRPTPHLRILARSPELDPARAQIHTPHFQKKKHTQAPQGAATGAAVGAVVGAALAWLVSIQIVAIPGLAPLVAAGPVLAALAGAGAGAGGALGWIVGMLAGLSLPGYVAKRYPGRIRRGGILLSVHCDSREWCNRAKKTLKDTGAWNISSASEVAADYGTKDQPTERAPAQQTTEYVAHETKK